MSFICGSSAIIPDAKYNLFSNFARTKRCPYAGDGDVYIINDKTRTANNQVIDYKSIPFESGRIHFLDTGGSYSQEYIKIDGVNYTDRSSTPFRKGAYCGQQYELARKIAYINQNLRPGDPVYCPDIVLTHEGNAISASLK